MIKRHFNNLNGLRFIAAATVAFSHLETLKQYWDIPFIYNRFFENSAQIAVTFFFVLSGFLIMWWFLEETNGDTTKITVRRFYSNRISRTWPLYFLVVLISIFISCINGTFSNDPLAVKRYLAYLFFLPNTADVFFQKDIYLSPAWSLAVEEFFYLFFPLFLLKIKKEKLLLVLFVLSVLFILISIVANRIFIKIFFPYFPSDNPTNIVTTFFERYRFYSFFLGSSVAVLLFQKRIQEKFLQSDIYYITTGVLLCILFFNGITFSFLTQQIYSVLFAMFIFFVAGCNRATALLNNNFMVWGGKISYGIYMLHMFVILRLINQGKFLLLGENELTSIVISWVVYLICVLLLAHLSYKLFENPIRIKMRKQLFIKTSKIETSPE